MHRSIRQVAVLGSGVMGSRIACHFANAGFQVWLLDIVPQALAETEQAQGLTLDDPTVRNRVVNASLQAALKASPSPVFTPGTAARIRTGNFTDDMPVIADCDWVIEAVVENLDIKRSVFEQVERYRKPGTLVTTNTSGIPIHLMNEGRSADFRQHFCGTHFFNPPRYLPLLEIIPTADTDPGVVDDLIRFGDLFLGKSTVLCKDTPAFIANRVGVFSIMAVLSAMEALGLSIDEVDALTGPVIGHPKSATFRTGDVVGIDTLVWVAQGLYAHCPDDEARALFRVPAFVEKLVAEGRLGDKTGSGFYKKEKGPEGSRILTLDIQTMAYRPKEKARFPSLEAARASEDLGERLRVLLKGQDKAGDFLRRFHYHLFAYVAHRIPEIADEVYKIDDAMRAGFGWALGPFELWDLLGVAPTVAQMEKEGIGLPAWVKDMLQAGHEHFYQVEAGGRRYYDQRSGSYESIPGTGAFIILAHRKEVWKNSVCRVLDLGDGVLCVDWKTKMNTIGGEVITGINRAIALAEEGFAGLVIGNEGAAFSAGANVGMIFMMAAEQEWDDLHQAVKMFQNASMRIRYSGIPVVVAAHGLTLGGGCELCLHADQVQAAAESYFGLVELGVGLIPAGGGSKELTLRASAAYRPGQVELPVLQDCYLTIATAKVSGSAAEAYALRLLREGRDAYTMNPRRLLHDAKNAVLALAERGYVRPAPARIRVLGREALAAMLTGINGMWRGQFISDHDRKIAQKLAWVMSGGDLSQPQEVSEQYLLDLEREAFVSLCGERKTLERIESLLKTGKTLRN